MGCFFFFFKQKTAYEMRISDWSSDVCSSDLVRVTDHQYPIVDNVGLVDPTAVQTYIDLLFQYVDWGDRVISLRGIGEKHTPKEGLFREPVWITPAWQAPANTIAKHAARWAQWHAACFMVPEVMRPDARTEEHTSELQSPMRLSYA